MNDLEAAKLSALLESRQRQTDQTIANILAANDLRHEAEFAEVNLTIEQQNRRRWDALRLNHHPMIARRVRAKDTK